jgi:NAD(P)-dependent dehydrogenase (short-subunit alcohol dehydrogenase family)
MTSILRLEGKNALVTGAATGIGAAITSALADAGANVACQATCGMPEDIAGAALFTRCPSSRGATDS